MQSDRTMKTLAGILFAAVICMAAFKARAQGDTNKMPFEMSKPGLDVGLIVTDIEKSKKFYGEGLGLKSLPPFTLQSGEVVTRYQSGATAIKLRVMNPAPPKTEKGSSFAANGIRLMTMFVKDAAGITKRLVDNGYADPKFGDRVAAGYRVGFVADPDDNRIELLEFGPEATQETLDRFQIGLTVTDVEKAKEFYGKTLGLKERAPQQMRQGMMEYFYIAGSTTVKFWAPTDARPTRTGKIGDYQGIRYFTFGVKDVDAVHEALKAKGVKIQTPPVNLGTLARIMLVYDPDGNTIEFAGPIPRTTN